MSLLVCVTIFMLVKHHLWLAVRNYPWYNKIPDRYIYSVPQHPLLENKLVCLVFLAFIVVCPYHVVIRLSLSTFVSHSI